MRFDAAARRAQRVLDVQHFVEEHVLDGKTRHHGAIEPAIHHNLIECGIEAAELGAPGARAPAQAGPVQPAAEVAAIEARKHGRQIVNRAARAGFNAAAPRAAQRVDAAARGRRNGVAPVGRQQFSRRAPPVDSRKQDGGGGLENHRAAPNAARRTGARARNPA